MTTSRFGRTNRRRFVATSAIGGAAILSAGQLPPVGKLPGPPAVLAQDSSEDVPMFRGNAARTGQMPGPGPDDSSGMEIIWQFATRGRIVSSPAIADGVVFFGSNDRHLYAVNAIDGSERWRLMFDLQIMSSPAVAEGVVYIGEGFSESYFPGEEDPRNLYAINAEDGIERWRFATGGKVLSSPAVVDGVMYFGCYDFNIYAVDAANGTERWRFATGGTTQSSPAVVDGVVYVGSNDSNIYAIDAADGTERWRFTTNSPGTASQAVDDGIVYVATTGSVVHAIDAADGTERWQLEIGYGTQSAPAVAEGIVYVSSSNNVHAIDATTGTERWRFETSASMLFPSSPVVVAGVVYIGDGDHSGANGNLYAIQADDGSERWRFETNEQILTSPTVVDGVVYVGTEGGTLYAIGSRG